MKLAAVIARSAATKQSSRRSASDRVVDCFPPGSSTRGSLAKAPLTQPMSPR